MFDKTHLPPAKFECVVIADTHYMIDVGNRSLEFESRRKQTQRAGIALKQVSTLNSEFTIHLGDLVQEYPETPDFKQAIGEARKQIDSCNLQPCFVAGNHDVGDKTDPTMPTHPATAESLTTFHDLFGPSWYSFDQDNCHFIVLNSQILNSEIPEARDQWQWFESDLEKHKNKRLFLFFHLPLYIWDKNEPGLGHYDNINEPDRSKLFALIQKYNIELLFTAHVHYPFYDQIESTRYFIAPSTSFTRPGFGHLYASAPPPEQGRDDVGKLGFYLLRIHANRTNVHFVRTKGAMGLPTRKRLITCTSADLPNSPIGITLNHPITPIAELPQTYPFAIRQKARNDQHFLSCLELGAKFVRVPSQDLRDPYQTKRLQMLQSEGISAVATYLEPDASTLPELIADNKDLVHTWEIQLPGTSQPSNDLLQTLKKCASLTELSLCPIISNERVPGKQHLRTRIGYKLEELENLNASLQNSDLHLSRVLCRIPPNASPWDFIQTLSAHTHSHIDRIDLSLELDTQADGLNTKRVAEAVFAMTTLSGSRLFVEPLIDFDRTMDVTHGLLNTLCNPRPTFHALTNLNTVLFSPVHSQDYSALPSQSDDTFQTHFLTNQGRNLALLPNTDQMSAPHLIFPEASSIQVYDLATGETECLSQDQSLTITSDFPVLLMS